MNANKRIIVTSVAAAVVMLGIGVLYYGGKTQNDSAVIVSAGLTDTQSPEQAAETNNESEADVKKPPKTVVVYISGEVNSPGVYELPAGSRVVDIVQMAGGMTPDAGSDVNLAKVIYDGEQIVVNKAGEAPVSIDEPDVAEEDTPHRIININTASKKELMSLPGIGEVIADGIIRYRDKNGDFANKEDIKNVPRIGEKLYTELEDLISVE